MLHRTDQDVGFWFERAAETGGPVLELACGTGRLTVALASKGVEVVGLDNNWDMLASAKKRSLERSRDRYGERSRRSDQEEWPLFLGADMRHFALARRFPLIFIGYNSLQLLTAPGDMVACLRVAREHLDRGGLVGVEVTDFQHGGADGPEDESSPHDLAEAEGISLSGTLVHELAARISYYRRHFAGDGWKLQSEVIVRSVDRVELEALFEEAGLTALRWWHEGATVRSVAAVATPAAAPPAVPK